MDHLLDDAPCGYLSFDDDGLVIAINRTLSRWLGMTTDAVVGRSMERLLAPGGAIFHQTHFFPLLKLHGEVGEIYLSLLTSVGDKLPMLVNAVRREVGGTPRNDCILVPMRQRHRFEGELVHARESAEVARDAKSLFLSTLAHEVRNQLASISALTDVMHQGMHGPLTDEQQEDLALILSVGKDIDHLVDEVQRYSRTEAGSEPCQLQPVALDQAFDSVESRTRALWQADEISYEREDCASRPMVVADPILLHQILLNLLTNAAKFTPAGGAVCCRFLDVPDSGMIRIEVCDTGCGIREEDLERVFEPFVRVPGKVTAGGKGAGLGLAISRQLATMMGGTLRACGGRDQGALFVLELPQAQD